MGLTLDSSTPAVAVVHSDTVTSSSFTPPAGAVLYAIAFHEVSSLTSDRTSTISDSTGLTWTSQVSTPLTGANGGLVRLWTTVVVTSQAMTVTATITLNGSTQGALRVLVFTGADTTTPAEAAANGASTAAISQSLTATVSGGIPYLANYDRTGAAIPTAGSGTTTDYGQKPRFVTYWIAKRAAISPAGSATITSTAPTSGDNSWVAFVVRPAPVGPQLVASYYVTSAGNNTNTLTTSSFTPANGEVIVVKMTTWDTAVSMGTVTGGSQTYTSQIVEAPGGFNGWVGETTTTIAGSPGSMTVSATPSATSRHNMVVERWSNAQLASTPVTVGATATSGAASSSLTTTGANSIISWAGVDEQSVDPATRAYLGSGVDEGVDDGHVGSNTVHYFAYQAVATAGSTSFGLSAPTGQKWVIAGVEIQTLGTSGGQTGAAALTAASSLTAGATKQVAGAVAMTAASGLTAAASQGTSGAVAMTAASSLTSAAVVTQPGAVAMSSASAMTVAATRIQPGAVSMSAASGLTAGATQTNAAAVSMSSASSLTTSAVQTGVGAAAMTSVSGMTVAGTVIQPGAVAMTSASSLSAAATTGSTTGVTMTAGSSLTAGATQTNAAAVTMSAASSLSTAGVRVQPGAVAMTASSALSAAANQGVQGAAAMTAASSLTAAGTTTTGGTGATLSAASSMTVAGVATGQGAATLSAASSLSASAGGSQSGAAAMTASSGLSADGVRTAAGAVAMSSASSLSTAGLRIVIGAVAMSSASNLTAAGTVTSGGVGVAMTATSSLTAGALAQQAAAVAMSALSGLTAGANLGQRAQVSMTAASSLSATVYVPPTFYRPGILTPGSTRTAPSAGTLPYPRLTPGTVRGPTYTSGG